MGKRDADSCSATSGTSKSSNERSRKPPRFSLRHLFYRARSASTPKSMRVMRSQSELETRSTSSVHSSPVDKEATINSSNSGSEELAIVIPKRTKDSIECPVCWSYKPKENFPSVSTCHHRSCRECLCKYFRIEITESRINIACPECNEKFHPCDIKMILEDENLMSKYEEFMLRRVLVSDPDARWCPAPDCGYAVLASGCASCPKLRCERPGCDTSFCYHCKQYWHPNQTCDAARAERCSNLRNSSLSYSHESSSQNDIKPCPRCAAFIVKMDDGSCNHMTCAVCGAEFCWLCMKEISDLHYLSPSGCTFWGKKPWSRKKKILWQLGTLVGAPVGIGLIAGIAVPAIVIGVPVWVGRRLHVRYNYMTKHRRNLVVAGGVTASILVSPVLAGLAVGIGVPILLAYVYGVVPISLCRSGGCGVSTTDSGGVRFEFDDDQDGTTVGGATSNAGADTHSVETSGPNVANPSIGPSIGEMSLGCSLSASGSHMDRVGVLRDDDRDSASNRALAGASLSGSLCEGATAGPSGYHNRLEVQVDVSTNPSLQPKRNSLSSESANFSLGDAKSATVSFCDDASTKALAGSICMRDRDNNSAIIPPLEVQVDVVTGTSRYHPSNDYCANDSTSQKVAPQSSQGSPTSVRSVNFGSEEIMGQPGSRRKFKRQSMSLGDSIHEHVESGLELSSTQSLVPADDDDEDGRLSPCTCATLLALTKHRTKGPMYCSGAATLCTYCQSVSSGSSSAENVASHSSSISCCDGTISHSVGLPEVESDRPSLLCEVGALSHTTRDSGVDSASNVPPATSASTSASAFHLASSSSSAHPTDFLAAPSASSSINMSMCKSDGDVTRLGCRSKTLTHQPLLKSTSLASHGADPLHLCHNGNLEEMRHLEACASGSTSSSSSSSSSACETSVLIGNHSCSSRSSTSS